MIQSNAAAYERARRLANLAVFAINMQCRRLEAAEPEDEAFVFRKWYDFEFLLLALIRLRRIAQQAAGLPEVAVVLTPALSEFDTTLPGLKLMRDVSEHIDEYAFDKGRKREVKREMLEVSTLDSDGPTLGWLGGELNAARALQASGALFRAIQQAGTSFSQSA